MILTKNHFFDLEKKIGTEGAFNILMVVNEIRKSFFEALRFSTIIKLNNYMKKYKELLDNFTNIDIHIIGIDDKNTYSNEIIIRFMVYQKKYEAMIKDIKSSINHKQIGYLLDYSCPSNLGGTSKIAYTLTLIKNKNECIYQPNWIDPTKINILKQNNTILFSYRCIKEETKHYNSINIIGKKCMKLIKKLELPYNISITITYN